MLSGDNSILSRATQARERTEFAKVKEEIALAQAEAVGNHYLGGSSDTIEAQVLAKLTAAGYTIGSENSGTIQDISLSSNSVTIEEGGNAAEVTATLNTSGGSTNYVLIEGQYYPLNKKANGDIELGETGKKELTNSTVTLSDVTVAPTGSINATLDSSTGKVTITSTNVTADENATVKLQNNGTDYATINVTVKKASIAINPATTSIGFGKTKTLSVTLADYQKGTVTWSVTSGKDTYITIPENSTGTSVEVTAKNTAGTAKIKATYKTGTAGAEVSVDSEECEITVANIREGTLDEKGLTWADLSSLAKQISASSSINDYDAGPITIGGKTLKIGDTKSLQIGSDIYLAEIIGFKHDNLAISAQTGGYSEKTKAGITFQLKELMKTSHNMNSSDTNEGGWKDTAMRKYLNTDTNNVFSQLESNAQNVIVTVKKDYMASYNAEAVAATPSEDKLWLLACSEIWSDGYNNGYGYARLKEGEQYQYYITATNGVTYNNSSGNPKLVKSIINGSAKYWWLRSPYYNNGNGFCCVNSNGLADGRNYGSSGNGGMAFGFSI